MEGSQFSFHLNKLLKFGLVTKEKNLYFLSAQGKNVANTFDIDSKNPLKQAKHSVVFCAFRTIDGVKQTLLYTRKKNPFYDHQGFPTGKVMYGDGIIETAERELTEETGLIGKAELVGIRHFRVYYPTKSELVEDKVMNICRVDSPEGELEGNEEGEFYWVDMENVAEAVTNPLPEFEEIFTMLQNYDGAISFAENNHYPSIF
jgi:8-oxo-dGTP pyrophosphatase MutT (NUDIX family)